MALPEEDFRHPTTTSGYRFRAFQISSHGQRLDPGSAHDRRPMSAYSSDLTSQSARFRRT